MKKNKRAIDMLSYIPAAIIFILFGEFIIDQLIHRRITTELIPAFCAIILTLFAVTIAKRFKKGIRIFLCTGMWTFVVSFAVFVSYLAFVAISADEVTCDADTTVVIYGCKVNGSNPSNALKERLDGAIEFLSENNSAAVIVCGARGINETVTEASVMKKYLILHGVKNEIIEEDNSKTTVANITEAQKLIEKNGLSDNTFVSISSWYHMARIKYISSKYGFDTRLYPAKPKSFYAVITSPLIREYMAFTKTLIFLT